MKCLLDLDGVLTDFHSHWYSAHPQFKRPDPWPDGVWSLAQLHGISFKESCEGLSIAFWNTMPWMPDGKDILALLESKFGAENICLLSSNAVTYAGVSAYGKVCWIERELPRYKHRYFLGAAKGFLAHKNVCLIDDKNENIDDFWAEEGEGFLLPRPWNRKYFFADQTLQQLDNFLYTL